MTDLEKAKLAKQKAIKLLTTQAREGHILPFTKLTFPKYDINWHHKLLAQYLDKFIKKEIRRLMIFMPPRHGKSELTSRRLPALLHGLYPNDELLAVSYNSELASDMTIDCQRIMDKPEYKNIFPEVRIMAQGSKGGYARNSNEHEILPFKHEDKTYTWHTGSYRSAGVGGSFTGRGGDWCFPKGVDVSTSSGNVDISILKVGDYVWTYNNEKRTRELRRVEAIHNRDVTELVRVTTHKGRSLLCTPEHPFYTKERGYWAAALLRNQDELIVEVGLHEEKRHACRNELLFLLKGVYKAEMRIRKIIKAWTQRKLLFKCLLKESSQYKEQKTLCDLPKENRKQAKKVLRRMQEKHDKKFSNYALSQIFSGHKATNKPKRLLLLFVMRLKEKVNSSSYRPFKKQQFRYKLNNCLSKLSYFLSSQVRAENIKKVQRISTKKITVYDIQVEGNHNFFANGVLVHNCLIDDPIKNREDADSAAFREKLWKFYASTIRTRLEGEGSMLITLTRWHDDDLAGRLLRLAKSDPNADQWTVLTLPAIKTSDDNPIDPRIKGDVLWPAKFPLAEMLKTKASVGSRDFSALYQQSPTAEGGNIFKDEFFKYTRVMPTDFDQMIQSWDMATKDKQTSDYVVGQVWGRKGAYKYLVYQVRGRFGFSKTCEKIIEVSRLYPQAHRKLVEAKANGPAVIDALKKQVSGLVEVEPRGDKVARAHSVTPEFESGHVIFPHADIAPWIGDYLNEMLSFPTAVNDDQVDATTQALDYLRKAATLYLPTAGHSG